MEQRDKVLQGGYVFFDRKPVVMKPWNPIDDFTKDDITSVPTWIQLKGLDIKYWGEKSLFKIVGQIGTPLQVDNVTKYEFDHDIELEVKYEWLPLVCYNCSGLGHETKNCRKKMEGKDTVKQQWIPKEHVNEVEKMASTVDEEGFQKVEKRKKVIIDDVPAATEVANRFDVLENQEKEVLNSCTREGGDPSTSNG
ncbi:uncharacterized protein LOC133795319 [Humulus lupulus]|uniref:uncharacterized protein LOC133795319 n=1 Tax=Humulus lupulus TaxID=3486 RepID=UPI002B4143DC|nr:uncharacterized protein LOC133795319 [Humulus lupulus]